MDLAGVIQLIGILGAAACLTGGVRLVRETRHERGWVRAAPWLLIGCALVVVTVMLLARRGGAL